MNITLDGFKDRLDELKKDECWYIVRQDTTFWKQCYYVYILNKIKDIDNGKTLEDNFTEEIENINNLKTKLKLSTNHRALKIAQYFGLLTHGNQYKNTNPTDIFYKIQNLTKGEFENTELYSDIIKTQIEKIFISSNLDEEYNGIRKDFRLFPIMFLYKLLLSIGDVTEEYEISKEEYDNFVFTQTIYEKYLDSLILIMMFRENYAKYSLIYKGLKVNKKLESRFNLIIEQLETLEVKDNKIKIKDGYLNYIRQRIKEYENSYLMLSILTYTPIPKPHQRIFFGAPGTGKSYLLNKEAKECFSDNYERVTFHTNYFYSHFVGSYKPFPKILKLKDGSMKKDEDGNIQESITYKYVEGVLLRVLLRAFKNPSENYLLIIEEINRADVAAVFGDMFQLLDRDKNGRSEYSVATSKEMQEFLKFELDECSDDIKRQFGNEYEKISFPSNFYIWATMNSADQGVMPLDTAFKRRWNFEYMDINSSANDEEFKKYCFKSRDGYKISWNDFRIALNEKLLELEIPEDKLLGPYFVSKSVLEMEDINERTKIIKYKVLMYLYEDVVKTCRNTVFNETKSYSDVCNKFDKNVLGLFKLDLKEELIKADNEDN
ncbi:AAA family ATPase [Campylobacter canadensis]|uniref:AAA family ATPase n=1 Tax=Campylobacter canadensis TaxID=449520 RepID=UPI00155726BA|nr:AAA family ATPase [Campylobacter canadensis]MBZ7995077.1 AAA family ATPase [Campylobacter canadensis]MBZ7996648.1 AAA family ATPase [Campylobacter canadensis]MBZ8000255.1 AAA family ATPase [Campylobacter canadensis]MBZ8002277.1 AAA family ATPase [Campylobacter canadensis]MBZ8003417.1 AAA family ATPase [Campylobacter canadensis]